MDLRASFRNNFGCEAEFVVRAPGRVNLIGEHIDYSGYGVLPMAIEHSVIAAVAVNDSGQIVLVNANEKYKTYEGSVKDIYINKEKPEWHDYFLCGYKGMLEQLQVPAAAGVSILIDGQIPPSAGLSSSSALVCCAAIVTLRAVTGHAFDLLPRDKVATLCASCEKYIGTEGGGMDQSICLLAEEGKAKRIEFHPIRASTVCLPEDIVFVVAHSCTELNKAASAQFNQRVVECRLAAQLLAQKHGFEWKSMRTLGALQKHVGKGLAAMLDLVDEHLHPEPYSLAEIAKALNISMDDLKEISLGENTKDMLQFSLYPRTVHVFSEAKRVDDFEMVCSETMPNASTKLGSLMNESHESCANLYQCSCKELDELVKDCRQAGAVGSRLTGAGWGGCVVSAVPKEIQANFLASLKSSFYSRSDERKAKFESCVFVTAPASGAEVIEIGDENMD